MKKTFYCIICFLFLIPLVVNADESYEYIDFRANVVNDTIINDTSIEIFASLSSDIENAIDLTNEFELIEKTWSVCAIEDCSSTDEVLDDAVFEEDKNYLLVMKLLVSSENNVFSIENSKITFNSVPIEELSGEFVNTDNSYILKVRVNVKKTTKEENPPSDEEIEKPKIIQAIAEDECLLGLSVCCTNMAGISVCAWLIFATTLLLLIIIICVIKSKKNLK